MLNNANDISGLKNGALLTFFAITLFYFFESMQMSYFNVLAPYYLNKGFHQNQIAGLSAAYYYGNVVGLLPVGFALDRFPLRRILLWAISGSVISALFLAMGHSYPIEWMARFFCGFFGGTFSFIGGIRVLICIFPNRFNFFMGLFIAAGMFAGFICQYPLLCVVNHIGIQGTMTVMVILGLIVAFFNLVYLRPPVLQKTDSGHHSQYPGNTKSMCLEILKNYRNWLDCFMVAFLDTPISILGTLWGIVLLMNFYHFSDGTSAGIIMSLFAGLMLGSVIWGILGERCHYSPWIIASGAGMSFATLIFMMFGQGVNAIIIAVLFFIFGLFSSCQSLGFTWLTKNMRPELIGRNSAFNSMILMGAGGGFKQLGAYLLASTPFFTHTSSVNLLIFMAAGMFLVTCYVILRKKIFKNLVY